MSVQPHNQPAQPKADGFNLAKCLGTAKQLQGLDTVTFRTDSDSQVHSKPIGTFNADTCTFGNSFNHCALVDALLKSVKPEFIRLYYRYNGVLDVTVWFK